EMVRKLQSRHLVSHGAYGKIELCTKGEEIGKRMLRKHRLAERFLSFLGITKGLHEQACRLEHAVSDQLEKKMADMADGKRCLADLDMGVAAKIVSIDSDSASVKRLQELGLTKGTIVVLFSKAPFRGPVDILVRDTRLALGRKLALRIHTRLVR
ncbi:MAG: metal-dependent transcriptional regulator, partial [Bacteroidota bacterium]